MTDFYSLNVRQLKNEDAFALIKTSIEFLEPQKSILDTTGQTALAQLADTSAKFGQQVNLLQAHRLTPRIEELNLTCDAIWSEIKNTLVFAGKSVVNTGKNEAAQQLIAFLKPYWGSNSLPVNTQSKLQGEMFAKYNAAEEMKTAAKTVGVDNLMVALEAENTLLGKAWIERADDQGSKKADAAAYELKREATRLYNALCSIIQNQYRFVPSDELLALINDLNEVRAKYAARIANKKEKPVEGD